LRPVLSASVSENAFPEIADEIPPKSEESPEPKELRESPKVADNDWFVVLSPTSDDDARLDTPSIPSELGEFPPTFASLAAGR
ncbi:MAG: hypothetical protein ACK52S_18425, partial [Pirellula sp.]